MKKPLFYILNIKQRCLVNVLNDKILLFCEYPSDNTYKNHDVGFFILKLSGKMIIEIKILQRIW